MFAKRILLAAALGTGVAVVPLTAQDIAIQAKVDQKLADLKAESTVLEAILEADKLAPSSKPKAVERIKTALNELDRSLLLGKSKRDELVAKLNAKIATYDPKPVTPAADASKMKLDAKMAAEQARLEHEEVTKALKKTKELYDANRFTEATKTITEIHAKYPNNPATLALRGNNLTAGNLAAWNNLQAKFAQAWVENEQNLLKTATPISGEIAFPDKQRWAELTAARKDREKIKLTPKEKTILESLGTTVMVVIKDRPFQEGLQEFSNQIKQELHVDLASLEQQGLDVNKRINFSGNVSARTALRALLQPQGLTFVVKDEIIHVVTLEKAEKDMLTTRSYDISDIIDSGGPFANAVVWGPQLSYQQTMQNADAIVALVKESVDPRCWKDKGGFSTITFHLPTKSLIVRASTEVHAALAGAVVK